MTTSDFESYKKRLETALRASGNKLTHQRMVIYQELSSVDDHPSAETLHQRIASGFPYISLETVYRTLGLFESIGLVRRVSTVNKKSRYDACMSPHFHLVCNTCARINDMHTGNFDVQSLLSGINGWGRVDSIDVVLTGECKECREAGANKTR